MTMVRLFHSVIAKRYHTRAGRAAAGRAQLTQWIAKSRSGLSPRPMAARVTGYRAATSSCFGTILHHRTGTHAPSRRLQGLRHSINGLRGWAPGHQRGVASVRRPAWQHPQWRGPHFMGLPGSCHSPSLPRAVFRSRSCVLRRSPLRPSPCRARRPRSRAGRGRAPRSSPACPPPASPARHRGL